MNPEILDDMALEEAAKERFGISLDITKVIVRNMPTSHTTKASVFLTSKNLLYAFVHGRAVLTLGDIRKMIKRMGLTAEVYLPPAAQPSYFNDVAVQKFKTVYPGRRDISDADLRYYRLSSPYNPALVLIRSVDEGVIKQFDASDSSRWRTAAKLQYKKIQAK